MNDYSLAEKDYYEKLVGGVETDSTPVEDNKHYISIDIGVKNLLSVYDNNGSSFIVSGHSLLNTNCR